MVKVYDAGKDFVNTKRFLGKMRKRDILPTARSLAEEGKRALASNTPVDSGVTAGSWGYVIDNSRGSLSITWTNNEGGGRVPVVILLQYGHATGTGGYVQGYDFINPAIRPIFDRIAENAWKVVTEA